MRGGLHIDNDLAAAAHIDGFAIDGQRMPASVGGQIVALAVELFRVQVLHVGIERGKSPGHVLVVPGHDKGQPRHGYAGGVVARRAQVGHIPDVRRGNLQVHVVSQKRPAAGRVAAGHHPVVRAVGAIRADGPAHQIFQRARFGGFVSGQRRGKADFGILVLLVFIQTRRGFGMRLAQVQANSRRRTVAPRTDRIKIGFEFGVVEPGGNVCTRQLGRSVHVQPLHQQHSHANRVHAAPGLGPIAQQPELDGKMMRLLALRNVEIDAAGVVVEARAIGGRHPRVDALGGHANLQNALRLVVLDERRTENFGQLAVGAAPQAVHLPEPVLRGDVALRDEEIVLRSGGDVGNAVAVAAHSDRRGQSRQMRVAV